MKILGIETSCDETAAAVVELRNDKPGAILHSNAVLSSMDLHAAYGGVVPEIAARSHVESIIPVIEKALEEAFSLEDGRWKMEGSGSKKQTPSSQLPAPEVDLWDQIDGIAVTYGAGLGGSLLVGVLTARTLALVKNKPLYAINHVEGHVYANFLTQTKLPDYSLPARAPEFPLLALIVSGGHSQLVLFRDHFDYTLIGQTHDDAIGEAFDKVAKVLGLPYPGGPSISKKALEGDPYVFDFPKAKLTTVSTELVKLRREMQTASASRLSAGLGGGEQRTEPYMKYGEGVAEPPTTPGAKNSGRVAGSAGKQAAVASGAGYDFSFSGLKTAVLRAAQAEIGEDHAFPSHQLSERLSEAQKANIAASFQRVAIETVVDKTVLAFEEFKPKSVVIGGGVAASAELRKQLAERLPVAIDYTDPKLCTDNGAMIAALGCYHALLGRPTADPYTLDIAPNLSM